MIDTGDTLSLATATLHENGATAIFVLVSHCTVQSDSSSLKKLSNLPIVRLVVTNTLPQTHLMTEVNEEARANGTVTDGAVVKSPVALHQNGANGLNDHGSALNGANRIKGKSKVPGVSEKLTVLDISPLLAESIRRTHNGESISLLFGDWAERAGMAGY
jgi:ribose-phosphate pyrophosphokinase